MSDEPICAALAYAQPPAAGNACGHDAEHALREALCSPLFRELPDGGYPPEDHPGGCALFEKIGLAE